MQTLNWSQDRIMRSDNYQLRENSVFCCFWLNIYTVQHILEECFALLELGMYAFPKGWHLYDCASSLDLWEFTLIIKHHIANFTSVYELYSITYDFL